MDNVIKFEKRSSGSISGECRCISCGHEWEGHADIGVFEIECPSCKTTKGVFKKFCQRHEDHFECNCGCEFFGITPSGIYCVNCATWVRPYG